jgi:hypothetical protein
MKQNTELLPFHAINEFMRSDFRMHIVRETLTSLDDLTENKRNAINQLIKKLVKVPGFRNSDKAPVVVKLLPTVTVFEKNPFLVAAIIDGWLSIHQELAQQVYSVLEHRNWKLFPPDMEISSISDIQGIIQEWRVLPISIDRSKLPGFYTIWPAENAFEAIYETFTQLYPDAISSIDEVSLMAVWLSLRLPYNIEETDTNTDAVLHDNEQ